MRIIIIAVVFCLLVAPAEAQLLKLRRTDLGNRQANLIESLSLKGDLRLRHESIARRSAGRPSRQRQRFRLRLAGEIGLPEYLSVGLRLASGAGEQVSSNQSFDNLGSQKGIFIDRAYLQWKPALAQDGALRVSAGKIAYPLWRPYSADAVWDADVSPEGFSQSGEWLFPSLGGLFFANALQMRTDEDSGSRADQWLLAQQVGAEWKLPLGTRLRAAAAFHHWINERAGTFGQVALNQGNRRDGAGALLREFDVLELTGQYSLWLSRIPLRVQGTWIKNTAGKGNFAVGPGGAQDSGFQTGAILGEVKDRRSWELAYFYKRVETDATVADVADSDFGLGGTNRRGHIVWAAYSPRDWMQLKAKFFHTRVIEEGLAPGPEDVNRLQMDFSILF